MPDSTDAAASHDKAVSEKPLPTSAESPPEYPGGEEEEERPVPGAGSREGLRAWLQVLGAFCVYLNTWGLMNAWGVFQTYYEVDLLQAQPSASIAWIGSTQSCLLFVASIFVGPLFDLGFCSSLLYTGSGLMLVGSFLVGISHRFYQILLTQGVMIGLGVGCLFLPAPAVVSQYFDRNLSLAVSVASMGSALGGVIYPAIFTQLEPRIGFAWTTRVIGFVILVTSLPILAMRSKTAPKAPVRIVDWRSLTDVPFMMLNLGLCLGFMGLYSIITYIQLYAEARTTVSDRLADNILIILNAGSLVGRLVLGYFADKTGSINMQTAMTLTAVILTFCLLAIRTAAGVVVFALLFGVASGTFMGLPVASIANVSDDKSKIGTRIGMTLFIVGIGALVSYPIAGAIVGDSENWVGLVAFSGALLIASTAVLTATRLLKVGRQWTKAL